jgi:four helix bundle protein
MNRKELEERLIGNATSIIALCRRCKFDEFTCHLSAQIVRSSSSAALNYGEAQSAESRKDFIHKLSVVLKELRETGINLKLIYHSDVCKDQDFLERVISENRSLTAILQRSVETAKKKTS